MLFRFCAVALDESSIAILGGEVPTTDGIAISAEMKTYNIDNAEWTSQPGNDRLNEKGEKQIPFFCRYVGEKERSCVCFCQN